MHYEINIAKNGQHYFATAPRSITHLDKAREVFQDLSSRFSPGEGYEIRITRVETTGSPVKESEYWRRGYPNREEYLKDLADQHDVPLGAVRVLSKQMGASEDFDGLVAALGEPF